MGEMVSIVILVARRLWVQSTWHAMAFLCGVTCFPGTPAPFHSKDMHDRLISGDSKLAAGLDVCVFFPVTSGRGSSPPTHDTKVDKELGKISGM